MIGAQLTLPAFAILGNMSKKIAVTNCYFIDLSTNTSKKKWEYTIYGQVGYGVSNSGIQN